MKFYKIFLLVVSVSVCLFAQEIEKPLVKHVVVIGVDGMSPHGMKNADTPTFDYLMENGAYTFHARAVLPTSSSPNWASMLMGAGPEQHGITSNGWDVDDHILPPSVLGKGNRFPSIYSLIREKTPNAETGAIYHWKGFGNLFEKKLVSYDKHFKTEYETTINTARYIKKHKPVYTFVQLDHVDGAGHKYGHGTEGYFKSIAYTDSLIKIMYDAIKDAGIADETLLLIMSDHGGIGYGHGGETIEEMEIPFILFGKGVKKGYKINHPVNVYDNASTAAFALGLKQPYAWIGRAVKSAFKGYKAPESYGSIKRPEKPTIFPEKKLYEPAGGLFVDEYPVVKIAADEKDLEIRYTLDGSNPARDSYLYKDEFQLKKSGVVKAVTFDKNERRSLISKAYFRIVKSDSKNGINYRYFEGKNWHKLPVFENLKPAGTGKTFELRIKDIDHRKEQFAVEFSAYIKIERPGDYNFYTLSDDGSKLYINGKEVVDNDGDHGTEEKSGKINLSKGMHKIKVTYYNAGGGAWLDVFYKGPDTPKQIIPASVLYVSN